MWLWRGVRHYANHLVTAPRRFLIAEVFFLLVREHSLTSQFPQALKGFELSPINQPPMIPYRGSSHRLYPCRVSHFVPVVEVWTLIPQLII